MSRFGLRTRPTVGMSSLMVGLSGGFSPEKIDGLRVWIDAADSSTITASGSSVSSVTSKDLNARVFNKLGTTISTGVDTINGLNVLTHTAGYLRSADAASVWSFMHHEAKYTVLMVIETDNLATLAGFYGTNAGELTNHGCYHYLHTNGLHYSYGTRGTSSNAIWLLGGVSMGTWNTPQIFRGRFDPLNGTAAQRAKIRRNQETELGSNTWTNASASTTPSFTLEIGAVGNAVYPLTGKLAEVLVYEADHTTWSTEYGDLYEYLSGKWGI